MSCPIFTVINEDATERVSLVDDNGVGNAIPTVQNFRDLDIKHDYATGDLGITAIRLVHDFTLSLDYVPEHVREKLLYMMHQRHRVTLADPTIAPEASVFGWRPARIVNTTLGGQTAYDLTGGYALQSLGDSDEWGFWNPDTHQMSGPLANREAPLLKTVNGLAYQPGRETTNRASNPYPESATDGHGSGKSGWYLGDASGIATKTHITDGFDNTLCPDTLRISTDGKAGSISLTQSAYFTPGHDDDGGWIPPSTSTCWGVVWVKGTFPSTAEIEHGPDGNKGSYDISGHDFSQWTRIDVGEYNATYSEFNFAINCTCAAGEIADFQVGPTMVVLEDSTQAHGGPGNFTDETNHTTAQSLEEIRMTALSFPSPQAGSATIWFSIPTGSDVLSLTDYREFRSALFNLPHTAGGSWDGNVWLIQQSAADPSVYKIRMATLDSTAAYWELPRPATQLGPGLHSVTITWGSLGLNCYYDGEQLEPDSGNPVGFNPGSGTMTFAGGIQGPYMGGSLLFHGFSIQEKEFDSTTAPYVGAGITDNVARNLCDTTQGRLYHIIAVPSIPLRQEGPSKWMGDLVMRQVWYDYTNPAWFAEEV